MHWFSDLKIAKKLTFTFALTALVAAVIGLTGARALRKVADADTELYKGAMVPAIALEQMSTHFHRMRSNLWELAFEKDAEKRAGLAAKVKERRESISALQA
ncbi:MAG: hypothetical protein HGA98_06215, partial [Deltaproteobacteria bacterium]|nr:hypothetical protein [Deltaproteobacteria bacterium]